MDGGIPSSYCNQSAGRSMDKTNAQLQLATAYVRDTGCHLFLTGKAGTGKTTFLRNLANARPKRLVVTAPTGVAAINAGGVTLHSFFQLPFGPFVPGSPTNRSQYRFSNEKIGIIKSLDLLIIDEISMVRADLLDGVDSVLRRLRRNEQSFGGVQLLMIGDLFQLPPVVKEDDWRLLAPHYASPYFFSSAALDRAEMVTIELQRIYRQADSRFIRLLNRVRSDQADTDLLRDLNARHEPGFSANENSGTITLTTHNRKADQINAARLKVLERPTHQYDAEIEGEFPDQAYPTAATLQLKQGAQVMFVRNDLSPEKRYFNGKIGTIVHISGDDIRIRCTGESDEIVVEPVTWENIEYTLDPKTMEISENTIGTFKQLPLRLAWAITIHKSQGLTFDKAIIDAQAAFAYGQVYVALSRCRTLEGMVLSSPLPSTAIKTDPAIQRFSEQAGHHPPTKDHLAAAKIAYQQRLLLECFDFQRLRAVLRRMVGLAMGNDQVVRIFGVADVRELQAEIEDDICTVGDRFQRQLQGLFPADAPPSKDAAVIDRITKASSYFHEKLAGLEKRVEALQVESDNQSVKQKINRNLKLVREAVAVKLAAAQSCRDGFSPATYLRAVSAAATAGIKTKAPVSAAVYTESDIAHPGLFQILKAWRSRKAEAESVPHYRVMHQKTLIQLAVNLPDTPSALKAIRGIGDRLAERYGEELVALISGYRREHGIDTVTLPGPEHARTPTDMPEPRKIDTKRATLDLFRKGLKLSQIARERGLVRSTIEGHMAHWVAAGKVTIDDLLPTQKIDTIKDALSRMPGKPFAAVKQALGDDVTYAEIKLVLAQLKHDDAAGGSDA